MQILKKGSTGGEVSLLQLGLNRAGLGPLREDGLLGPETEAALREFQRRSGLRPDGVLGPLTEEAIEPWFTGFLRHTVRRGDSLFRIAGAYDTTLSALETANPGLDPFQLRPGERLTVPLAFPVTPVTIAYTGALTEYIVRGLRARYPRGLETRVIGRSVLGRSLYALRLGRGPRRVLLNAAHHGNEWITVPLVLRFAEELLRAGETGEDFAGVPAEEILERVTADIVPAVNPDGMDLVTGALQHGEAYERAVKMAASYPGIPFPSGWKANIRGTDPNLQYPAEWERARGIKFALGYTRPGPAGYVGPGPLSEPESRALYDYTRARNPEAVMAYHTQGQEIYWTFGDRVPPGGEEPALLMAERSGYALRNPPREAGYAGYKDWFIQDYDRPGYTVEAGLGENPLPLRDFESIWQANRGILLTFMLGE